MSDFDRCYAAALRILNVRFNSESELRRKLASKEFDRGTVDAAIERLREERWLDDARFAAAFVRTRLRKGVGVLRIRRELSAAGVNDDVAATAVGEHRDPDAERASLTALCTKKIAIIARRHGSEYARSEAGRKKLAAYLLNQGYDMAAVLDVMRETLRRSGER